MLTIGKYLHQTKIPGNAPPMAPTSYSPRVLNDAYDDSAASLLEDSVGHRWIFVGGSLEHGCMG